MFKKFSLAYAYGLLVAIVAAQNQNATDDNRHRVRHHRKPDDSIAQQLEDEHSIGNLHPSLTLHAEVAGSTTDESSLSSEFIVRVREPVQAVTSATAISEYGVDKGYVGDKLTSTILVADVDKETEEGTTALIAVDKMTGDAHGIVQKAGGGGRGKGMQFSQKFGMKALAYEAEEFIPPKWECGVDKLTQNPGMRKLSSDASRSHHSHDNSHEHHHGHHHDSHKHVVGKNIDMALQHIQDNLRGANIVRTGDQRKLEEGGQGYNYQVDLYIEVDQALVNLNQGVLDPNTINYVNAIVTGANTIYESEIDTHLNVVEIALTSNYDSFTNTSAALDKMLDIYASGTWHRSGINLHHALLAKSLGGGRAYIGTLCDSEGGFGLSADLSGNFVSIGLATVYDMVVFMHEIGHNFGSGHTFEIAAFDPLIDTCSLICPAQLPLNGSATIMSYCHLCDGGFSNIAYTFGGKYSGSGHRSDTNSYTNSHLAGLGLVSVDPERVNVVMFDHVSSRGSCTQASSPTPSPTKTPSSSPSVSPTKAPSKTQSPNTVTCQGRILTVEITTDDNPIQTGWTLTRMDTNQIIQTSPGYTVLNAFHSDEYCIPDNVEYLFTILDSAGDGFGGQGQYKVIYGDEVVASGAVFFLSESTTFGSVVPVTTDTPTTKPTNAGGQTPRPTGKDAGGRGRGKADKGDGGRGKADKKDGRGKADKAAKANVVVGLDGVELQHGVDEATDEEVLQPSVDQAEKMAKAEVNDEGEDVE